MHPRAQQRRRKVTSPKRGESCLSRYRLLFTFVVSMFIVVITALVAVLHHSDSDSSSSHPAISLGKGMPPSKLIQQKKTTIVSNAPRIFVAMPSLNDPDCAASIAHAFEMAEDPDRLFFGVYQQTDIDHYGDCLNLTALKCDPREHNDADFQAHPLCSRAWQVRVHRVRPTDAKGPTHGRVMADKQFKNEEYYLITDSHTWFRPKWDSLLIELHSSLPNSDFAVIAHYPRGDDQMSKALLSESKAMNQRNQPLRAQSYHICGSIFEKSVNKMPRNANGCYTRVRKDVSFVRTPFWAGGFAFSKSELLKQVPLDPHTPWLFHGEEFHYATRAWTHGYDFYSPPMDFLFHRYADRAKRAHMPSSPEIQKMRDLSEKRVNALWGLLDVRTPHVSNQQRQIIMKDLDRYPLGQRRTLEDFWKFAGIDPLKMTITVFDQSQWQKGGLEMVPWNSQS